MCLLAAAVAINATKARETRSAALSPEPSLGGRRHERQRVRRDYGFCVPHPPPCWLLRDRVAVVAHHCAGPVRAAALGQRGSHVGGRYPLLEHVVQLETIVVLEVDHDRPRRLS